MTRAAVLREVICVETPGGRSAHLVLFANERWLPLESAYPEEVRRERERGLRLAQVALLEGAGSTAAILRLFQAAWARILDLELDVVYAAVDEDDVPLYARLLFERTNWGNARWDFADYAEVEVLRLDVTTVRERAGRALAARFLRGRE